MIRQFRYLLASKMMMWVIDILPDQKAKENYSEAINKVVKTILNDIYTN